MNHSIVSPTFLRQRARQLKKEKSISQHQAYNEAARELGYSNYKNYLNILETNPNHKEALLKNIFSEKDTFKKAEFALSLMQNIKIPFHEQLDILQLFQHSDDSDAMQIVCEKSNFMKDEIQFFLLKDFLTEAGKDEIYFNQPQFIAKEIALTNLNYEIDKDEVYVDGEYKLMIESEFEVEDVYKEYPHCKDRQLFGAFEITIDRNKTITLVNSDIAW